MVELADLSERGLLRGRFTRILGRPAAEVFVDAEPAWPIGRFALVS